MRRDEHCLLDIVDAAQKILTFVGDKERAAFEAAPQAQAAVLYEILVIGEAVKLLSDEWRDQNPAIPLETDCANARSSDSQLLQCEVGYCLGRDNERCSRFDCLYYALASAGNVNTARPA